MKRRNEIPSIERERGRAGRTWQHVSRTNSAAPGRTVSGGDGAQPCRALRIDIADPANGVPRVYVVTVRGEVGVEAIARLTSGVRDSRDRLRAHAVTIRKASARESHLVVELHEGKNREVRRLFASIGHEVTRLKRVKLGGLELGSLEPGAWRELDAGEVRAAFPGAAVTRRRPDGERT